MTTKETKANVNANESAKANNVNNESAKVESTKVENESNVTNNVSDNNATDESSNESNESNESKQEATTEPTSEQIAAAKVETKHQKEIGERYTMEAPKEVEKTKFAGAYVLGVYRPTENRKNSDKTFYKIFYNGTIYDGYSATEFCDANGIERKHRTGNTPKIVTMLDKLQALKTAIEAIGSEDENFVNFAKIVASKIESEQLESQRAAFVAKYAAAIALFAEITEATCAKIYGADVLALALKLGYKFSDTKATDTKAKAKAKANK